jgi:gp32 DNA binding protein like
MERSRSDRDDRGSSRRERDEPASTRRGSSDRGSSRRERDEPESRGREERSSRGSSRDRDDDDRGSSRRSSGSSSGYQYKERSAEDARKRSSQNANDYDKILVDGIKMWKPNDGDNRIRILPPTWEGASHFGLDIFVNYGVGPDRQSYLCLAKMKGEPDPIDEERQQARKDGDEDYAKELTAKKRTLVYLIDRDHEKEGVQAWAMSWTIDRDIVKVSVDKASGEVLPIDHPEDGYDVEFEKKGAGLRTEYLGVAIARRSSPLGKSEWLDFAMDHPLPDQLNFFDYDHIAKVFGGGGAHKEKSRDDRAGGGRDDRDSKPSRSRDDDRDERKPARGREPEKNDDPTWDSIHEMTGDELEDLIDQEKLDIDPKEAKDDADLANWICDEMKLSKPASKTTTRRRVVDDDDNEDPAEKKLREMRERRRG